MDTIHKDDCYESDGKPSTLYQIGKWGALAAIAYFLWAEHRAHVIAFLPYAILLACPLMHVFMHGKHGHHTGSHDWKEPKQ